MEQSTSRSMAALKHIIAAQDLDKKFLDELFVLADQLNGKRNEDLKGRILATMFYEPSTRTRMSFESAMLRLGGSVLSTQDAKSSSSAVKGETPEDTMQMLNHYADAVVVRHPEAGTAARMATVATIPIISGGDGAKEHPTQALLDLYTIRRELGRTDTLHVVGVGDMKNGRTIRSLARLLTLYKGISFTFVAPPELAMGEDLKEYLKGVGAPVTETTDLAAGIRGAHVVYMTRIQKERFQDPAEYERLKDSYVLTRAHVDALEDKAIVMHPLPRVNEIATDVDSSPKAAYFRQASYGLSIRMALLKYLLG